MGICREETKHPDFPVSFMVVERKKDEFCEPWRIVDLELEFTGERFTPKELRELGRWLVQQGKRIGREFKSNGAPKA